MLTAADLPELMTVPCPRGPFRVPLAQFVMDWNRSASRAALIEDPPAHIGDDIVLPAISVIVHALAARDGEPVPDWVYEHRAVEDVAMFDHELDNGLDNPFGRWVRSNAPPESEYHRVFFDSRFLDKGTDRQWLPRV